MNNIECIVLDILFKSNRTIQIVKEKADRTTTTKSSDYC